MSAGCQVGYFYTVGILKGITQHVAVGANKDLGICGDFLLDPTLCKLQRQVATLSWARDGDPLSLYIMVVATVRASSMVMNKPALAELSV